MRIDPPAAASPAARLPLVDAARGAAVLAMAVYHLSWDLRYFGFITAEVESGLGWRLFARAIAGTFLFIVGVSLVLADRRGFDTRRFLRRLVVIAAGAAAVTVVTWFVTRDTFVFFGVLHNIAVSSVIGLAFVRAPVAAVLVASLLSFLAPSLLARPAFDHPALIWLGLGTTWPRSNDFVPVFPWFGVVLAGIAAARLWALAGIGDRPLAQQVPPSLLWIGRHSLAIYLLHQPILFGAAYLASVVAPPDLLGFEPAYVESCVASCIESEVDAGICRATCECAAERSQEAGLWRGLMRQSLGPEEETLYFALVDECRAAAAAR